MDRNAALARPQVRQPHKPVSSLAEDASARPRPAGFWLRFWAWLYDTAILTIILAFLTVLVKIAFGVALVSFLVGLVERGMTGSLGALLALAAFFLGWIVLALVLWFVEQLLGWLYYATFESGASRATPGKRLLALCVVDAQNQQISFGRATLRHVFKFAALFPALLVFLFLAGQLSQKGTATPATAAWLFVAALAAAPFLFFVFYGMAGWTRDRQALHDMLSGCYVVRSKELTSGQAFGLAIGSITFLLVVWIATSLVGVYRSASAIEQRTTTADTIAAPPPRVAEAPPPRVEPAVAARSAPAATAAAATMCEAIVAAQPDAILGPTPVVVMENPGKSCKMAATPAQQAAAIRVDVGPARDFRGRERILSESRREPSPTTTMREEDGLGDKAIVQIEGGGRFIRYFVLRADKTIEVEFWQVSPHDAGRARTITARLVEQVP